MAVKQDIVSCLAFHLIGSNVQVNQVRQVQVATSHVYFGSNDCFFITIISSIDHLHPLWEHFKLMKALIS